MTHDKKSTVEAALYRKKSRAVYAMLRIKDELMIALKTQNYQIAVYEIAKIHDAWVENRPWEKRLEECAINPEEKTK